MTKRATQDAISENFIMQAGRRFKSPFAEVIVYVVLKLNLLPDEAEAAAAAHKSNFNFGDSVFYCEHIFFPRRQFYIFPPFFLPKSFSG